MNNQFRFGFKLSGYERAVLKKLAEIEGGLSCAALIRQLIRRHARTQGIWKPDRTKQSLRKEGS